MTIRLVPQEVLESRENEMRQLIASDALAHALDIDDPVYGQAFRRFLILSRWSSSGAGSLPDLDEATLFCSRYYWFLRSIRLYASTDGPDAGLEQQAYPMLERADLDIDGSIIEQIEARVEMEVGGPRP